MITIRREQNESYAYFSDGTLAALRGRLYVPKNRPLG